MTTSTTPLATRRRGMDLPSGRLAVWWVIASEIVIFGGLLASYVMHRLGHAGFGDQAAHTNVWIGAFNTLVLLTSSLSAVLGHAAAERGDGARAARMLRYTTAGGGVFLVVKALEWTAEIRAGYTITSNLFWSFYYTAAGLHAAHVLVGMIVLTIVASSAAKNQHLDRVENIGIYWHFVDVIWIFLFPLLYIAK